MKFSNFLWIISQCQKFFIEYSCTCIAVYFDFLGSQKGHKLLDQLKLWQLCPEVEVAVWQTFSVIVQCSYTQAELVLWHLQENSIFTLGKSIYNKQNDEQCLLDIKNLPLGSLDNSVKNLFLQGLFFYWITIFFYDRFFYTNQTLYHLWSFFSIICICLLRYNMAV